MIEPGDLYGTYILSLRADGWVEIHRGDGRGDELLSHDDALTVVSAAKDVLNRYIDNEPGTSRPSQ